MKSNDAAEPPQKVVFSEIWGYLMQGDENDLTGLERLTDICYFSASLTKEGRIPGTVARPAITLDDGSQPKVFLVITELSNPSLMHFSLSPMYGVRPLLIDDICRISEDFDGVQIDFEAVSPDDAESFWDFLKELRDQLPSEKMLSIAVPARTELKSDAYAYEKIAPIVDRMIIMAYDEHWSTSSPGPVASLSWCSSVVDYTQGIVDNDKIVMGLPLYGRAWQDKRLARAMGFQNVQKIITEKSPKKSYQPETGPSLEYSENVVVKLFYDDLRSLREKLQMYKSKNIKAVAFWRMGLGPSDLWSSLDNEGSAETPGGDQPHPGSPSDSPY